MKKVKIMLTAVIVLGTVGGVLAYKAKRQTFMCTAATVNHTCDPSPNCGSQRVQRGLSASGAEICTTAPVGGSCVGLQCPVFTKTISD